ncbi:MAG TPA: crosslink repair DNA glycosylase YcaQ family protein [Luteibacter sp.]|nr:crosslink repair DNA glycosylase YcaQ family protein [Luteibacter sp.]
MIVLTPHQARLLQLGAQGLLAPPRRRARAADIAACVARMAMLQIDTINVVARSPYLVLFSRLGNYPLHWLEDALAGGDLAETWAHEACFVTAADYPWHRAFREQRGGHWSSRHAARMHAEHREGMDALLERIRIQGPMRAADFEHAVGAGSTGWWAWKPEKRWLEAWFAMGELMVLRRERFQRVYDLAGRVLAGHRSLDAPLPEPSSVRRHFIEQSVRALGITRARWIADYFRLKPRVDDKELLALVADGSLLEVAVKGWPDKAYVHPEHGELATRAAAGRLRASRTSLLSPFDPLVWDRARVLAMFDFEYTIECYTPAPKRRYGYYSLPILHGGRLVGRLDAKAHRADGRFEVKAIWLEPDVVADEVLADAVAGALREMANWHGTPAVTVGRSDPKSFAGLLRRSLRE